MQNSSVNWIFQHNLVFEFFRIYGRVKLEPASNTKCSESLLHRVVRSPDLEWGNNNPTNSAAPNLTTTTTTPPPIRPKDNAEETNGDFLENALIPKDYTVYSIPWPSGTKVLLHFHLKAELKALF